MAKLRIKNVVETRFISDITELDPFQVKFRQARTRETTSREELFADLSQVVHEDNRIVEFKTARNSFEIYAREVFSTFAGCDLVNGDTNKPFFTFRDDGLLGPTLNMSEAEFNEVWGALPVEVTMAIHEACIDVNPFWDVAKRQERASAIISKELAKPSEAT